MRKVKAVYSELATARGSAASTCALAATHRQAEEWESFLVEKGRASGVGTDGGHWAWGSWRWPTTREVCYVAGLGLHISLSLVGLKLETGTNIWEAVRY